MSYMSVVLCFSRIPQRHSNAETGSVKWDSELLSQNEKPKMHGWVVLDELSDSWPPDNGVRRKNI